MKLLVCISILFLSITVSNAQDLDEVFVTDSTTLIPENPVKEKSKKLHTGINVDAGYMLGGGIGSPFMTLSPFVSYPVTNRFGVDVGLSAGYGGLFFPNTTLEGQPKMLPMTQLFIFASGNYKLNEKLTVSGTAFKRIVDVQNPNNSVNPTTNYNFQGASVGFNYKISNNFSFGVQLHFNSPSGYSNYNPYGGLRVSPYGW
jgi:hypothetical protein